MQHTSKTQSDPVVKHKKPRSFINYESDDDDIDDEEENRDYNEAKDWVEFSDLKEVFYKNYRSEPLPNTLHNGKEIESTTGLNLQQASDESFPCDDCNFISKDLNIHMIH